MDSMVLTGSRAIFWSPACLTAVLSFVSNAQAGVIQKQVSIAAPGMSNARPRCQRFLHCCAADRLARSQSSASSVLINHGQRSQIENQITFSGLLPNNGRENWILCSTPCKKSVVKIYNTVFYYPFLFKFHQ